MSSLDEHSVVSLSSDSSNNATKNASSKSASRGRNIRRASAPRLVAGKQTPSRRAKTTPAKKPKHTKKREVKEEVDEDEDEAISSESPASAEDDEDYDPLNAEPISTSRSQASRRPSLKRSSRAKLSTKLNSDEDYDEQKARRKGAARVRASFAKRSNADSVSDEGIISEDDFDEEDLPKKGTPLARMKSNKGSARPRGTSSKRRLSERQGDSRDGYAAMPKKSVKAPAKRSKLSMESISQITNENMNAAAENDMDENVYNQPSSQSIEDLGSTQQSTRSDTKPKKQGFGLLASKSESVPNELDLIANKRPNKILLFEVEDQDLDLGGDTGVVGSLHCKGKIATLDVKGRIYRGPVLPCNTCLIVSVAGDQAKIDGVSEYFVATRPGDSVFCSERLVSGTIEHTADIDDLDFNVNAMSSQVSQKDEVAAADPKKKSTVTKKKAVKRKS